MADGIEPQGVVEASLDAIDSSEEVAKKKVRRSLRETMKLRQPEFRYGELLLLLIVTFIFNGSVTRQTRWHSLVLVLLESLTILLALVASRSKRFTVNLAIVVCSAAFASALCELIFNWHVFLAATSLLNVLLVVVAPIAVIKGIMRRRVVDFRTVLAALCLYVMFGMLFSAVFAAFQSVTDQQFFVQTAHGSPSDFSYFSFITLTTVGYGDLTAAQPTGRTVAAFEAMFGQLYLVSVVAVLVSNMGPIFSKNAATDIDDDLDEVKSADPAAQD
jgi:hypothetical protein